MAESTQLAFRTLKGIGLLDAAPAYQAPGGFTRYSNLNAPLTGRPEGNFRCCVYSPDGRFFAWASPEQVFVIDTSLGHVVTTLPGTNVYELGFSPLGTYIITWQRPSKEEDGNATKNLRVSRTIDSSAGSEGERDVVGKFVQKSQTGWNLQYTDDEAFCARVVTNEVQFYRSNDLSTVWNKLHVEGVTDFAVAPGKEHRVAVFVPERKGQPAAVKIFNVPKWETPVSQKTFFKGDKVQLKWNSTGTCLIVLAQTDVDKSNRSYYGETNLYVMSSIGEFDSRIQLDKEGPIHDVSWSPTGKSFGVVYGYMPAKTTIFDTKANAVHDFAIGPRNTILFSPHGRFVLVAGFGNLAGQMDIYDMSKDYAKLTTIEATNASVCEWSPDGRHILTATTSPRLRVDNGLRVWHVAGGLMYKEDMNELYHVVWKPQSITKHPLEDPLGPAPAPHPSALAYLGTVKTPSKPAGAYRPPGARGTSTPLHFKREDEGGAAYVNNGISSTSGNGVNGFGPRRRRDVPGAEAVDGSAALPPGAAPGGVGVAQGAEAAGDEQLSKAALKNKKKREAKKAREKEGVALDGEGDPSQSVGGGSNGSLPLRDGAPQAPQQQQQYQQQQRNVPRYPPGLHPPSTPRQHQQHEPRTPQAPRSPAPASSIPPQAASTAPEAAQAPARPSVPASAPGPALVAAIAQEADPASPAGGSPRDKKLRSLHKKLRAIEELKMRQAGGEALELSQLSKIRTEDGVRKELNALGAE